MKPKYQWCSIQMFERIIGIDIVPSNQHVKTYAKKLAKRLGFKNIQQYINSYPGRFKIDSSLICKARELAIDKSVYISSNSIIIKDNQIPNPNTFFDSCMHVVIECDNQNDCVQTRVKKYCFVEDRGGIIAPTIEEAKKMYKSNSIPKQDAWMCIDWSEDSIL